MQIQKIELEFFSFGAEEKNSLDIPLLARDYPTQSVVQCNPTDQVSGLAAWNGLYMDEV